MVDTILVVEDDPVQRAMISMLLTKKLGYKVIAAADGNEAVSYIKSSNIGEIDAVLLDIEMPVMDGFEALKIIRKYRSDLPILMLTGTDDTSIAVKAIKDGANDFIVKPPDPSHLDIAIKNAIKFSALTRELDKLKRDREGALTFADLVGYNSGLAEAVSYGRKAAASDVPVLIMGETGVGKELFARAIHGESKRMGSPFIAINCGAIPENLVESILFGHEKGSFTGAITRTIGKFREAENGTIFLDEIGELPMEAQVKLLRVLQQKEVEPVGAGKAVKINVRIVSATNRDLRKDVQDGKFREDLYFRLNVLPITIPPLRERQQDILLLTDYFIKRLTVSEGISSKNLELDAKEYLTGKTWSGNVRELENFIHRALVLSDGESISRNSLMQLHDANNISAPIVERRVTPSLHINLSKADGSFKTMIDIELEAMNSVLNHYENNITRAADALGIAKSTFYRKIKDG